MAQCKVWKFLTVGTGFNSLINETIPRALYKRWVERLDDVCAIGERLFDVADQGAVVWFGVRSAVIVTFGDSYGTEPFFIGICATCAVDSHGKIGFTGCVALNLLKRVGEVFIQLFCVVVILLPRFR